ncbi:hypothetical protein ACN38_g8731 [Penicillium nordicum]|uniref:Uncharacterized protein n=1 Tax=Penicillium nordicum TaxID=229535 RepID=A0A0M8NVW4_9EURO|nr:hypothetical protein ACN38_g8731 [Penicillium nordicum]
MVGNWQCWFDILVLARGQSTDMFLIRFFMAGIWIIGSDGRLNCDSIVAAHSRNRPILPLASGCQPRKTKLVRISFAFKAFADASLTNGFCPVASATLFTACYTSRAW